MDNFLAVAGVVLDYAMRVLLPALGVVATVGSWRAATQNRRTTETVAAIEHARRHRELLPQFEVHCTKAGDTRADLWLNLTGPADLDRLDEITVSIRDDMPRTGSDIAGGPTSEEVAQVIWGPYRFNTGANGADKFGRAVAPFSLALGDSTRRALERSLPPKWNTDHDAWRHEYKNKPVRLKLACRREGHEPWVIPVEVEVTAAQRTFFV